LWYVFSALIYLALFLKAGEQVKKAALMKQEWSVVENLFLVLLTVAIS
jgi:hypothetical protein